MARRGRLGLFAAVWSAVLVLGLTLALVIAPVILPGPATLASVPGGPLDLEATVNADPGVANAAVGGPANVTRPAPTEPTTIASSRGSTPATFRVQKPVVPDGPRRIGIQVGHWDAEVAPPELGARIRTQTGTSWGGVQERQINRDIALRIKGILEKQGYVVDVLPVTIPNGYLADAFVSLHGDGDGTGENSGFKMAYTTRRTPYEAALLESIKETYGAATGLAWDSGRVTRDMTNYYAHAWTRYMNATAPFTPSVILEMGYVSHAYDRRLMTTKPDLLATAVATGIERFLDAHPRETLFGKDLLVQQSRFRIPSLP